MLRLKIVTVFIIAVVLFIPQARQVAAGTMSDDVARKTQDWFDTFKAYMHEKKKEAVNHGKVLLEKSDQTIDRLAARADGASAEAKTGYHKTIADLKQKRAAAATKLDELGNATHRTPGRMQKMGLPRLTMPSTMPRQQR